MISMPFLFFSFVFCMDMEKKNNTFNLVQRNLKKKKSQKGQVFPSRVLNLAAVLFW